MKLDFRQRLLTTTLLVGASMIASPAFAQTAQTNTPSPPDNSATPTVPETTTPVEGQTTVPSTSAEGENVRGAQDIVITGSRIPQPNLTSASPVTVLSSQEVKLSGTTRTEDLINSLPQSFAAQGSNISNGSTGTASVNLRGLGSARTLVLVNGRRLMPGDPRQGSVADINFVPSALVKRVDVLTGGASSVYGADAVSGVVNFIMDTNFRGLRLDGQVSTFMHDNDVADPILNANLAQGFKAPRGLSINGGAQDIAAAFGSSFDDDRGSIMAYATYRKQDAVLQATRDYSYCALAARTNAQGGRGSSSGVGGANFPRDFNCGGSATSNVTSIFLRNFGNPQNVQGTTLATQTLQPGTIPFNFGPYNFFQRPDERYTFGAFAEYELSAGAKPYLEVMFMDDTSNSRIAPSGNFFNTGVINCDNPLLSEQQRGIICEPATYNPADANPARTTTLSDQGNLFGVEPIFGPDPDGTGPLKAPLLGFTSPTVFTDATGATFTQGIAYIGRRNVEGGGREDHLNHTAYRIVGGVRGDLLRGLSYDAYYQFGTTRLSQVYQNDFSITRLRRALDVIDDPSTPGVVDPVCRSVVTGEDPNCVPYNVFQQGGVNEAALGYLQVPGFQRGHVNETVANANLTLEAGEYGVQTPWADRGVAINVGAEYRKEALETETDQAFQTGDLAGQGAPTLPVSGQFDVREVFTEVQIPVISNSFIEEFTLTAGYRYSDYKVADNHFNTDTYKVSAELAPIEDVRMRASYNRAVRAPNVVELFTNQFVGLGGTIDPCAGEANSAGLVNGLTAAQCARTGVTAAQFGNIQPNPAGQYNALFGGNPNLTPEKADSITAGVVLQPRWVPGLALTVDYFDIKVKNLISTLGYSTIINTCIATGDPFFCSKIFRGPGSGSLFAGSNPTPYIETTNTNIGGLRTKGFDINGSYSRRIGGMGTLNLSYVSTILDTLEIDTGVPGTTAGLDGKFDCAGLYGTTCGSFLSGAPNPKYRHKLRTGFTLPNGLGISGQWRYFSSVKNDQLRADCDITGRTPTQGCAVPTTGTPSVAPGNQKINAANYFDLALTARLADRYNFRLGANNILDRQPPIVGSEVAGAPFGNGNTFPQVYDALGRYLFAGVTIDF